MSLMAQAGGDVPDPGTDELTSRLAKYPVDRYPVQHATVAFHLGTAYLQRGRAADALHTLRTAYEIFGRLGMHLEEAKAMTMQGVALREAGRYHLAQQSFEEAARAFEELQQPVEQAAASYDLGLVLQALGCSNAAQEAMVSAYELFLSAGQLAQAGTAARERGSWLLTAGEASSALPLLSEAALLSERGGDLAGMGAASNALGLAHLACGDAAASTDAFARAVGAFPRSMRPAEHAMAKSNLALAYEQVGNLARARLAARQSLAVQSADPLVHAQASSVLDRCRGTTQADLLTVLEAEPLQSWSATVREEALRWCDAPSVERLPAVAEFVYGLLGAAAPYDLAETLLAVLLELPPEQYSDLVSAIVEGTGRVSPENGERVRAVMGSAMARFAIPQWQRLASSLNAAAAAAGQPGGWR